MQVKLKDTCPYPTLVLDADTAAEKKTLAAIRDAIVHHNGRVNSGEKITFGSTAVGGPAKSNTIQVVLPLGN